MEKSEGEQLQEKLFMKNKNLGEDDPKFLEEAIEFCEDYKTFLTYKTEREVVDNIIPRLEENGYKKFVRGTKYSPGAKVYFCNRGKGLIMVTVGKKSVAEGLRMSVSHIDSPRLDFKPNPFFEDTNMAFFKTHYYGGIKKYQWSAIPLALRGVVMLKGGKKVNVNIGEDPADPSFCITDLLPHLGREQMKKPASEVITGEQLNILLGCWPYNDEKVSEKVKLNIAKILFEKYGITEIDFQSSELCAVPAFAPRDMGFDRSMVAAYGQDDSVCAYASLIAELDTKDPEYTTVTVFADKEETGSDGNTGSASTAMRDFIEDFVSAYGCEVRHVFERSVCLSADVNAAYDPAWGEVYERNNASYLNKGAVVAKYGGGGGKYSTSDASAETMSFIRTILEEANIVWQVGELGKIDAGGGGTIAMFFANDNIDTVDIGVPVLSMHSPYEVTSKADVLMLYRAVYAFFNSNKSK